MIKQCDFPERSSARFFKGILQDCSLCGRDGFASALELAAGKQRDDCSECYRRHDDLAAFWQDLGNSADELGQIASNSQATRRLRAVLGSYAVRGRHRPLILPSTLKLEVTNRCNLRCGHCLAGSTSTSVGELSLNEVERVLAEAGTLGVRTVALVGGEPFLRSDLEDIVDAVCACDMVFSISTNATTLTREKIAAVKRPNLVKMSVSLDGTADFHDGLRGMPGAYAKATRGISILSEAGIKVAVAMVVTRKNRAMIPAVIEAAIGSGASYFVINDLIPTGRGKQMADQCLPFDEYREMTGEMGAYRQQYREQISILWKGMRPHEGPADDELGAFIKSKCGAALTELTVGHDGFVQPCPFLPKTGETVRHRSLGDIWYDSDELRVYQNRDTLRGGCGDCARKLSCSGCRARAYAHTTDVHGPDVRCPQCQ